MAKHSWFSRFTRRWGQAISQRSQSLRTRRRAARKRFGSVHMIEPLEDRMLLSAPTLEAIDNVTVNHSSPLIIGLDGEDADDDNLTYSVSIDGQNLTAEILGANDGVNYNRSLVLDVQYTLGGTTYTGTMVFELFEDLVPDATARIIEMVEAGHYDDLAFHRVINNFVIQTGSYEYDSGYTATSHNYSSFDDQFHVDLQHNDTGILSWAKRTPDDSASTDFFITDLDPTNQTSVNNLRNLDFNYSIFGKIVEGENVLQAITQVNTGTVNGLSNAPTTAVTITDARIETNEQNASLMLKVGDDYSAGEEVEVTVTADDGNGGTTSQTFTVVLQTDNDDVNAQINQSEYGADDQYSENVNNSDPYIATMNAVVVPFGTNVFKIQGVSYDADGYKDVDFSQYLTEGGTAQTGTATEQVSIAIFDGEVFSTASQWANYLDTTRYAIEDLEALPDGLTYTNNTSSSTRFTGSSYNSSTGTLSIEISMTRTDASLVGVYYIMIARYNVVGSPVNGQGYYSTGFDTQVVTMILQPETPSAITVNNLNSGQTNDSTPSVTVSGLTIGLGLRILDENDNVVGELDNITDATTTLSIDALADGAHTLRAVQYAVNDNTDEEAVSEVATSSEFTVDTEAPQAFTDVAFTDATSGVLYTYDVGHPQEDDSSITYSLSGAPAGMTINPDTAEITWNTPTDSHYPSVTFDIIATDTAGNTTTAEDVTITVNSFVDLSGVVFNDLNDNGNADSGEGMEGVLVFADINGNNILDETDIVDTTSASGSYSLPNVPAGTVVLHQTLADGYEQQSPSSDRLTMVQVITDGDDATVNNQATTVDGLTWAGALAMSNDGLFVYATSGISASSSDDGIAVFSRNPNDGTLSFVQFVDGITELNDPNAITISPDGRHVYVTCDNAGSDGIIIFSRDQNTGELTEVGSIVDGGLDAAGNTVGNIAGTVKVVVSSDNEFVYVASRFDDSVSVFERDRNTGNLTLVQELFDAVDLNGASQLTLSPNGDFLYVGLFEGIAVYSINAATGLLTHVENVDADSLSDMREMAITPDGKYLYAASNFDGKLNVFSRNTTTGELTFQSATNTYGTPSGLTISPDGSKLYMTAIFADQLHVFDIQSDGSLVINQTLEQGEADDLAQTVTGLDGAVTVLLDPNGHDVYVASRVGAGNISVFSDRTRAWTGIPYVREVTPTSNNHTGINFANTQVTVDVDDVQYNTLNYDADKPEGKSFNAPTNWSDQRSTINDITITFNRDLIDVDKTAITLTRIFDVDGSPITQTVTLNVNDISVVGDTLVISNLDLVDGVYEVVISTDFNAGMDSEYSTYFHQLKGDLNGDRLFNAVDLASMVYWQQLAADTDNYGFVPGYLDISNTLEQPTPDGRVDTHDFSQFVSYFGNFIPQDAVPIPDIILSSLESQPPVTAAMMAFTAPKSASLQLAWSDDEEESSDNTLLDQLDDSNMVLQMIASDE